MVVGGSGLGSSNNNLVDPWAVFFRLSKDGQELYRHENNVIDGGDPYESNTALCELDDGDLLVVGAFRRDFGRRGFLEILLL